MTKLTKTIQKLAFTIVPASLISISLATGANAAAIIDNGTIQLGVDDFGQLNVGGGSPSSGTGTTTVGLRYLPTGAESTAPGCLCEGWGVADSILGLAGYANNSSGTAGLTGISFTSTGSTATAVVNAAGIFEVTHAYAPTSTPFLYNAKVTIKNISDSVTNVLYRRVMDWDVEPTAFSEKVTIQGTASASAVKFASDDGFASSNPLSGPSSILFTGDAVDSGPADHGALFDFDFGALGAGASLVFDTFYGAAGTEAAALTALGEVGAEVYSFGQTALGGATGEPNTFIFAFAGVGGDPIVPPGNTEVPTPALLPGLIGMGVAALRKRKGEESAEA